LPKRVFFNRTQHTQVTRTHFYTHTHTCIYC